MPDNEIAKVNEFLSFFLQRTLPVRVLLCHAYTRGAVTKDMFLRRVVRLVQQFNGRVRCPVTNYTASQRSEVWGASPPKTRS